MHRKAMIPKWATTVTPLSKMVALFFLIALPVVCFYYGRAYQATLIQSEFVENKVVNEQQYDLNSPTPTTSSSAEATLTGKKQCSTAGDCGLLVCSGCFNKEWLKDAPTDLACRVFEGYRCECVNNTCVEVK